MIIALRPQTALRKKHKIATRDIIIMALKKEAKDHHLNIQRPLKKRIPQIPTQ
jgi:hypothetical protein